MPQNAVTEIATTAQENRGVAKRDRERSKVKNARAKKARIARVARSALETLQEENLDEYFKMNLTQILEIANNGYEFSVTIGHTCIKMNNGRDPGIFCGEARPYLPDNLVLTFRVTQTTTTEPVGPERQYMVGAPGAGGVPTYHLLDMNPPGLTGAVNLLDGALPHRNLSQKPSNNSC